MPFTDYSNAAGFGALNSGLSSLGGAIQDWQKQQKLADLGQKLQAGDYAGAAQAAIQAGDTGTALKLITLGNANKPDPQFNSLLGVGGQPAAAPASSGTSPAPVGGFDNAFNRTLGFEGTGPATTDNNGAPVKYGINQAANPDVNVAGLNQDQAKDIYKRRYWDTMGLDNVDPRLAHVAFDTAVNAGPGKAQELMDASGGDPNKMLALRQQFQNGLAQSNPDKYGAYADAWNSRIGNLRADINAPGGGAQVASNDDSSVPATTPKSRSVAADSTASDNSDAQEASLRGQQKMLAAGIAHYMGTGDTGKAKALELQYNAVGQQIKDLKDNYSIHTLGDGSMVAIAKSDPSKVIPINTGAPPKNVAEYNARGQIADQLGLQGDERKQYLLNGKVPDQARVLKPGDELYGPQGNVLAKNASASSMNDQTANFIAEQVIAGDNKALQNIGRGAQGAEDLRKIRGLVAQKAAERDIDASDILANIARQSGVLAQQRTFGTQTARMATASTEASGALDLLLQSSAKVSRTGFLPLTKAIQMAQTNLNDPNLAELKAAVTTASNTYARAISPTGVPHAADKEHAFAMMNSAQSEPALQAVVAQLKREIEIAHRAPEKAQTMMEDIRQKGKTNKTGGVVPPAEGATATNPTTGEKVMLRGGQWVPVQ